MPPTDRIIDANANRAREAARLLEDLARFVLDDADLAKRTKRIRHQITQELADVSPLDRIASRDTPGDVGTVISLDSESRRSSLVDLASSAASRLAEALRVIEECLKHCSTPERSVRFERLRYETYELERLVLLGLTRPPTQPTLCVLITESLCEHFHWLEVARLAIEGGVDAIQLREKDLTDRDLFHRACSLVELAQRHGVTVFINDRPDIAAGADAGGVHLGQTDLPVAIARKILGEGRLIGVSTCSPEQGKAAARAGADLIGIGPIFPSRTKPKSSLLGPAGFKAYMDEPELSAFPHLAISGITAENVSELVSAGCRGIAVSAAICRSQDPAQAAAELRNAMAAGNRSG
ncbi:MAG TPA: thiamine phosphate synthase [Phycisphaerales bacterium]|nr:thiamine phosphate synthase [Phycisphaerales bacterium]